MRYRESHISDQDLLLTADGELADRRAAEVRAHLSACWACRARMKDLEDTIADFVHAHQDDLEGRPPSPDGPRALLRARLAEMAAGPPPPVNVRAWGLVAAAAVLVFAGFLIQSRYFAPRPSDLEPDPRFTPGVALLVA